MIMGFKVDVLKLQHFKLEFKMTNYLFQVLLLVALIAGVMATDIVQEDEVLGFDPESVTDKRHGHGHGHCGCGGHGGHCGCGGHGEHGGHDGGHCHSDVCVDEPNGRIII